MEIKEKEYIETHFKYTDEFGEITELRKTHTASVQDDDDTFFLMEEFKLFLSSCGYAQNWVDKVQYVEDDEEVVKRKEVN